MTEDNKTPEQRLEDLNLALPSVPSAVGDYEPWVEVNGVQVSYLGLMGI